MLNFIGAQFNFTVTAEARYLATLNLIDELTGEPRELANTTFSGFVETTQGERMEMIVIPSDNLLQVSIPSLSEGIYEYAITATSEAGSNVRMMYGKVYAEGLSKREDARSFPARTLDVRLPDSIDRHVTLEWRATTAAQLAAAEAKKTAEGLSYIGEQAESALQKTEELLEQMESIGQMAEEAEEAKTAAEQAQAQVELMLENAPDEYIPTIGENGNWFINGLDTGVSAQGLDAEAVTSHVVSSIAELPTVGDARHVYYVDGVKYVWVVDNEGAGLWQATSGSGMEPATLSSLGAVKLGSSKLLGDTAGWIGANSAGQLGLAVATPTTNGAVRVGRTDVVQDGVLVGFNDLGQLAIPDGSFTIAPATLSRYGTIKLGSQYIVTNDRPFQVSIASLSDGRLCNNLVFNGALVHRSKDEWINDSTSSFVEDNFPINEGYFLGVRTSRSFSQSAANGLELNAPSTSTRGGYTSSSSLDDETAGASMDTPTLNAALKLRYASRVELEETLKEYIKSTLSLTSFEVLTQEEFDALTEIKSSTLYFVY